MDIARGSRVVTSDGRRVGDVTEVHPTYILVSSGIFPVRDTYIPLYAVEEATSDTTTLSITRAVLRTMDWKKPPKTPLETVRSDDLPDTAIEETTSYVDVPTQWTPDDSSAATETPYEPPAYDFGDWTQTSDEPTDDFVEGYDTLGIVTAGRLEVRYNLHLQIRDLGSGRPVVLLHDVLLETSQWDSLISRLLDVGYRVITLDWPGHGDSDSPLEGYDLESLTADLRTLIRTLDLENVALIGASLGATVALQYAATYQRRGINRLILLGPAAPRLTRTEDFDHGLPTETIEGWITRLQTNRPVFSRYLIGQMFAEAPDEMTLLWLWQMAMRCPAYVTTQLLRTLRDLDMREQLTRINVPVSIIHGTADRFTPPTLGQELAEALPLGEFLPVENGGHLLALEQPEIIADTIVAILERDDGWSSDDYVADDSTSADTEGDAVDAVMTPEDEDYAAEASISARETSEDEAGNGLPDTMMADDTASTEAVSNDTMLAPAHLAPSRVETADNVADVSGAGSSEIGPTEHQPIPH